MRRKLNTFVRFVNYHEQTFFKQVKCKKINKSYVLHFSLSDPANDVLLVTIKNFGFRISISGFISYRVRKKGRQCITIYRQVILRPALSISENIIPEVYRDNTQCVP